MAQQILTPNNQSLYPTPNQHVNFNFGNSIEEYRTSRYLNNILRIFSPDQVLWGLDLRNIRWSGNNLIVEINNGRLIQDSTLIDPMSTSLSTVFQLNNISPASRTNPNYAVVIFTEFDYKPVTSIPSNSPQLFNMRMGILNKTNNLIYLGDPISSSLGPAGQRYIWNTNRNRLIVFATHLNNFQNTAFQINIEGHIYNFRGCRINAHPFKYDTVSCFNVDGSIIENQPDDYDITGNQSEVISFPYSYYFNGTSSNISFPSTTLSQSSSTLSTWVWIQDFTTGKTSPGRMLCRGESNYNQMIAFYNGGVSFETDTNSNPHEIGGRVSGNIQNSNIKVNNWFHYSLVFENNVAHTYINGELINSVAIFNNLTLNSLGQGAPHDTYPGFFKGYLENFKIYNFALSKENIKDLYKTRDLTCKTHTPKQDIFFNAFSQRFHSYFDKGKQNFYISPEFGKLLRFIGENTIIEGFNISSASRTNTEVRAVIQKGRCLINDTYVEVNETRTVSFTQANMLDQSGYFVVSLSFLNDNSLRDNRLRYHITYFDQNNNSFGVFDKDKDQIILGVIDFVKNTSNNITSVFKRDIKNITLDGKLYNIYKDTTDSIKSMVDSGLIGAYTTSLSEGGHFIGDNQGRILAAVSPSVIQVLRL